MPCSQHNIALSPKPRGSHLITQEILKALPTPFPIETGLMHLFLPHTSAALTLNEAVSPEVQDDFLAHLDKMVPEDLPYYTHTLEGSDDMPAHIKSSLIGVSLSLPVSGGKLKLGTWQGIFLLENRNYGGPRQLTVTFLG